MNVDATDQAVMLDKEVNEVICISQLLLDRGLENWCGCEKCKSKKAIEVNQRDENIVL